MLYKLGKLVGLKYLAWIKINRIVLNAVVTMLGMEVWAQYLVNERCHGQCSLRAPLAAHAEKRGASWYLVYMCTSYEKKCQTPTFWFSRLHNQKARNITPHFIAHHLYFGVLYLLPWLGTVIFLLFVIRGLHVGGQHCLVCPIEKANCCCTVSSYL